MKIRMISPESLGGYHRNINSKPENVRIENGILKWSATNQAKSVVYYFNDLNKEGRVYSITRENSIRFFLGLLLCFNVKFG